MSKEGDNLLSTSGELEGSSKTAPSSQTSLMHGERDLNSQFTLSDIGLFLDDGTFVLGDYLIRVHLHPPPPLIFLRSDFLGYHQVKWFHMHPLALDEEEESK